MKKELPEKYRLKKEQSELYGSEASMGNTGVFRVPHHLNKVTFYLCMVGDANGWDHIGVKIINVARNIQRTPNYEEMNYIRKMFFEEEEIIVQFHPKKAEYLMEKNVLHLWRSQSDEIKKPTKAVLF